MNVLKRIVNVWFNWFLVCWAQFACIVFCLYCVASRIIEGVWPEGSEKWVGMLLLGEEGILSIEPAEEEEE